MRLDALILAALLGAAAAGCLDEPSDFALQVDLGLPEHFPAPSVPADNPLSAASVELGRHLFYDTRLSINETLACAGCHRQELAFADDLAVSPGATGDEGVLNAPSLSNVIYGQPLTWAHGTITTIEEQLLGPMFGESPLEMGITGSEQEISERLLADPVYVDLYEEVYPGQELNLDGARYALASFVRSLVSYRAPFDAFLAGDLSAISPQAKRGADLFYSERLGCSHCHAGFAFTTASRSSASSGQPSTPFHNIGLYNTDGQGAYPDAAPGLIVESGFERDMGRFRVPSLRNVALTAPYGHDGSVRSLEDFIQIYEDGGRNIAEGPHAGDGRLSPWRSDDLKSFELSVQERSELVSFLESLSDESFATDPRHANPW